MRIFPIGLVNELILRTFQINFDCFRRSGNYSENHLRTAITIRITEKFPKESKHDSIRNKIKDNLVEIVRYANTAVS